MLVLEGCVQPALAPDIDAAMARVLDRIGISLAARRRRRLLRRAAASPERATSEALAHRPAQHRRLVAARRARRRGDRRHRQRLRRDGQGLRPPAARTIAAYAAKAQADRGARARPGRDRRRRVDADRADGRDGPGPAAGRVPFAVHAAARHEAQAAGRGDPAGARPRADCRSPMRTCAAARRARTRSCSRSSRGELKANKLRGARSAGGPTSSPPRTSAASTHLDRRRAAPVRHWIELLDARMVGGERAPRERARCRRDADAAAAGPGRARATATSSRSRRAGWTTTATATSTTSPTTRTSTRSVNEHLIRVGGLDIAQRRRRSGCVVETCCRFHQPLSFPDTIDAGLRVAKLGNVVGHATRSACSARATTSRRRRGASCTCGSTARRSARSPVPPRIRAALEPLVRRQAASERAPSQRRLRIAARR